MKKYIQRFIQNHIGELVFLSLVLSGIIGIPAICKGAEPVDTIAFKGIITDVITDVSKTTTNKTTYKYYFLIDGYLISTTKESARKYNLCKKYKAKLDLNAVVSKKTKKIKKIIAN